MSRHPLSLRLLRFSRSRSGVAAVEFAILCPLYIFLFMGMTAYGIYFGAAHSVQQISADAARASVAGLDLSERKQLAKGFVERNAAGYLFIDPVKLTLDVETQQDATQFNVIVRYDARDLPIWGLFDGLSVPGQTILRRSTIRIGGI